METVNSVYLGRHEVLDVKEDGLLAGRRAASLLGLDCETLCPDGSWRRCRVEAARESNEALAEIVVSAPSWNECVPAKVLKVDWDTVFLRPDGKAVRALDLNLGDSLYCVRGLRGRAEYYEGRVLSIKSVENEGLCSITTEDPRGFFAPSYGPVVSANGEDMNIETFEVSPKKLRPWLGLSGDTPFAGSTDGGVTITNTTIGELVGEGSLGGMIRIRALGGKWVEFDVDKLSFSEPKNALRVDFEGVGRMAGRESSVVVSRDAAMIASDGSAVRARELSIGDEVLSLACKPIASDGGGRKDDVYRLRVAGIAECSCSNMYLVTTVNAETTDCDIAEFVSLGDGPLFSERGCGLKEEGLDVEDVLSLDRCAEVSSSTCEGGSLSVMVSTNTDVVFLEEGVTERVGKPTDIHPEIDCAYELGNGVGNIVDVTMHEVEDGVVLIKTEGMVRGCLECHVIVLRSDACLVKPDGTVVKASDVKKGQELMGLTRRDKKDVVYTACVTGTACWPRERMVEVAFNKGVGFVSFGGPVVSLGGMALDKLSYNLFGVADPKPVSVVDQIGSALEEFCKERFNKRLAEWGGKNIKAVFNVKRDDLGFCLITIDFKSEENGVVNNMTSTVLCHNREEAAKAIDNAFEQYKANDTDSPFSRLFWTTRGEFPQLGAGLKKFLQ